MMMVTLLIVCFAHLFERNIDMDVRVHGRLHSPGLAACCADRCSARALVCLNSTAKARCCRNGQLTHNTCVK